MRYHPPMAEKITPESALDTIERAARTCPGFRRAHARGLVTRGTFVATPDAARLSRAEHFQGASIPCEVRFSNAAAVPHAPDMESPKTGKVLGLGVRFHCPSGAVASFASINLPVFVARTPEEFIAFTEAQTAKDGKPDLRKVLWHVLTHPHILPGVKAATSLRPTRTFASETFHGLHTYYFVNEQGERQAARYRFLPRLTLPPYTAEEARQKPSHYLLDELRHRLDKEPFRYDLVATLAEPGDVLDAASTAWPEARRKISLGTLSIESVHEDQRAAEMLVFDPGGVVPGIETSDDPILKFRSRIYSVSFARRSKETRTDPAPEDMEQ